MCVYIYVYEISFYYIQFIHIIYFMEKKKNYLHWALRRLLWEDKKVLCKVWHCLNSQFCNFPKIYMQTNFLQHWCQGFIPYAKKEIKIPVSSGEDFFVIMLPGIIPLRKIFTELNWWRKKNVHKVFTRNLHLTW